MANSAVEGPSGPLRDGADLTPLIERSEAMEEHFGFVLSGLNARLVKQYDTSFQIEVYGEVTSVSGPSLAESVFIVFTAYDLDGRVIDRSEEGVYNANFFEVHTFGIGVGIPDGATLGAIKVHARRWT